MLWYGKEFRNLELNICYFSKHVIMSLDKSMLQLKLGDLFLTKTNNSHHNTK